MSERGLCAAWGEVTCECMQRAGADMMGSFTCQVEQLLSVNCIELG